MPASVYLCVHAVDLEIWPLARPDNSKAFISNQQCYGA